MRAPTRRLSRPARCGHRQLLRGDRRRLLGPAVGEQRHRQLHAGVSPAEAPLTEGIGDLLDLTEVAHRLGGPPLGEAQRSPPEEHHRPGVRRVLVGAGGQLALCLLELAAEHERPHQLGDRGRQEALEPHRRPQLDRLPGDGLAHRHGAELDREVAAHGQHPGAAHARAVAAGGVLGDGQRAVGQLGSIDEMQRTDPPPGVAALHLAELAEGGGLHALLREGDDLVVGQVAAGAVVGAQGEQHGQPAVALGGQQRPPLRQQRVVQGGGADQRSHQQVLQGRRGTRAQAVQGGPQPGADGVPVEVLGHALRLDDGHHRAGRDDRVLGLGGQREAREPARVPGAQQRLAQLEQQRGVIRAVGLLEGACQPAGRRLGGPLGERSPGAGAQGVAGPPGVQRWSGHQVHDHLLGIEAAVMQTAGDDRVEPVALRGRHPVGDGLANEGMDEGGALGRDEVARAQRLQCLGGHAGIETGGEGQQLGAGAFPERRQRAGDRPGILGQAVHAALHRSRHGGGDDVVDGRRRQLAV